MLLYVGGDGEREQQFVDALEVYTTVATDGRERSQVSALAQWKDASGHAAMQIHSS